MFKDDPKIITDYVNQCLSEFQANGKRMGLKFIYQDPEVCSLAFTGAGIDALCSLTRPAVAPIDLMLSSPHSPYTSK